MSVAVLRFHLDENLTPEIAAGLHQRGIDCSLTIEAGLRGTSDDVQFAFAVRENRVLITADQDFLKIAAERFDHHGIVFWRRRRHFGKLILDLEELARTRTSDQLRGMVIHIA